MNEELEMEDGVPASAFDNSLGHLLAELERIDLLIQQAVRRARAVHVGDPQFAGLCLTEQEVNSLLTQPCGLPHWANLALAPEPDSVREAVAQARTTLAQRRNASLAAGRRLRFAELARIFGLDDLDQDILLICLAPEMDLRYEKLYAYLQDDVTKKRPSVDLVLNLLCPTFAEKMQARSRFLPHSILIQQQLVQLLVDPSQPEPPLLRKGCKGDERIINFLLEHETVAEPLQSFVTYKQPATGWDQVPLLTDLKQRLSAFIRSGLSARQKTALYFQGAAGSGRFAAAAALCSEIGCGLLVVDGRHLLEHTEGEFLTRARLIARESFLKQAAIYWQAFDRLLKEDKAGACAAVLRSLEYSSPLVFLAGQLAWEPDADQLPGRMFIRIEFPATKAADRLAAWEQALARQQRASDVDLGAVSTRFRLNPGTIAAATRTAVNLARLREPDHGLVSMDDLFAACRVQSNHKLAGLAQKIEPKYRLEDIVLPPDPLQQLRDILAQARLGQVVLGDWGFERKLTLGKGLNVLFSGPPGTGKTMAAEVIASELGLELYKIDLSQVVSKYIGETEKNLDRIFREAHGSNAILFFDEADSLFGKRSEVKDAHDRYANIETGYLLQKMEEYEGIAILATNFRDNLDEAFVRRLHVIIEFPFPDEEYRRRLWQVAFPSEAPVGEDVDFGLLAREIRLAGGNIKNIALSAAFYAANNGRVIRMPHLIRAARREHQKLGRTWSEGEIHFGAADPSS